jgi:DNA-binding NarL/FixJ family response regulator
MPAIRLLIADDHDFFRHSLRQICELESDFEVVGEAANGEEAVKLAAQMQPDVILMDVEMPLVSGIMATRLITECSPAIRVIMLMLYQQDAYIQAALQVGAWGCLSKDIGRETLVNTVRKVFRGETIGRATSTAPKLVAATPRTRRVIEAELTLKAWRDPVFKQLLRADPKQALASEYGIELPAHIDLRLVEETVNHLYLRLPFVSIDPELSDEQLQQVSGGGATFFPGTPQVSPLSLAGFSEPGEW